MLIHKVKNKRLKTEITTIKTNIKFKTKKRKLKQSSSTSIEEDDDEDEIIPIKKQRLMLSPFESLSSKSGTLNNKSCRRQNNFTSPSTPPLQSTSSLSLVKSNPPLLNIKSRKRRIIKVCFI